MSESRRQMAKEYSAGEVEEKWMGQWKDEMYYFDWNSEKPYFIIDTPPPYPTGSFHIGNALNWCYIDFIARYKRMKGFEVMFPQGWDCHGLPTEVKVEEKHNISKNDVSREKFRELCVEFTEENIKKMKNTMRRLGFSIDWDKEFTTMYPEYFKKTQVSFVRMYNQGLIYVEHHPVTHCPRCETTIALAEIEYKTAQTKLNYINFGENKDLLIATTRPELVPACVAIAVNPEDDRYSHLVGKKVLVPTTSHYVDVIADEEVDPEFGTGIVMVCTFGDKQDVKWWKKHKLDLRVILDRNGRLGPQAGKYKGLKIEEARKRIIEDLKSEGRMVDQKMADHNVGACWRCKTPVEIIAEEQWFVKVEREKILDAARKLRWIPDHMYYRLESWVKEMEWDWVVSRQRVFATPIPAWYCKGCGEIKIAKEEWLPVDPTQWSPPEPCKCGSTEFQGEPDVLDTWVDSSITPLVITGWPQEQKEYPVHLRPQGHDIIRTWAFYTILRSLALTGQIPWYEIIVNGMVLGEDGRKMSKSLGNIISPDDVVVNYGADTMRQWAASGVLGSDVPFSWNEITAASRFQQKLWSLLRFTMTHIEDYTPSDNDLQFLRPADRWILSKLNRLIEQVDDDMYNYRFGEALKAIRSFTWYEYADNYIEMVKDRLYNGSEEEERTGKYTLYTVINCISRLLAPITPFLCEECWTNLLEEGSVHLQSFPIKGEVDEEAEQEGEVMKDIVSEVRRMKHDIGMALNAPLQSVKIYSPNHIDVRDISGALNAQVETLEEVPQIKTVITDLKPNYGKLGPELRDKSKEVIKKVSELGEEDKEKVTKGESLSLNISGEDIEIKSDWFQPVTEKRLGGKGVQVLEIGDVVVIVEP
ncbi:MAG: valine--tRNA ligase [Archaeoglobaceae archaeon]